MTSAKDKAIELLNGWAYDFCISQNDRIKMRKLLTQIEKEAKENASAEFYYKNHKVACDNCNL